MLKGSMREYFALCMAYISSLVRIPSVSGEEEAIGRYIERELILMGWPTEWVTTSDGRFSVFARLDDGGYGDSVMLAGHVDTVSPANGWETDPFEPILREGKAGQGKILGLGTCDMKSGLAIMLAMAKMAADKKTASRADKKRFTSLSLAFVPDEEAKSEGMKSLLLTDLSADFCLMPEPHFDAAVIGAPGKLLLEVTTTGKAAHGARPHEGINAVVDMSVLISAISREMPRSRDSGPSQPYVPLSIKGGPERYSLSVPEFCSALISKQLVPGETKESVLRSVRIFTESLGLRSNVRIETPPPYYPPYMLKDDGKWFRRFDEVCARQLGHIVPRVFGTGVSDANCLTCEGGVDTLIFGPRGGNLHQANEWVDIESIEKCLCVYADFLFKNAGDSEIEGEQGKAL
jgi:acetylornithine deacetylase/succinyl-diaminopimelate desuccinylase-like protein